LSKKYPLFELFLIENNLIDKNDIIQYSIKTKPKPKSNIEDYNKVELVSQINIA
jgi:hypothetical protein